ncbi:sodium:solute symporter [Halalkalibaculum sp. DA3122]|uniref:sodium:solute symporter n=1 Tax=unclassified Halalkalibaculum TaxID=2964617 RepID=UPI003754CA00
MLSNAQIGVVDISVIILYLLGILALGIWSVRKQKMSSKNYFLAARSLKWPVIGAALFASNISTIHIVGLAASGFNDGLVWGNFEWMAAFLLIILGLVFAPFYFENEIATLPEFLEKRYGPFARSFLAFLGIIGALFMHIGVSLYAGAVVVENFFGIDVVVSILLISFITVLYTAIGGLKAVVVTETLQTVILITGSFLVTLLAIWSLPEYGIDSWQALKQAAKPEQFSMIHTHEDSPLPWYAVLLGYPVLGIWYWCADQTIVQRVLGARSLYDAKTGPIFAGFIKILPVFFMVLPGVLAYVLFGSQIQDSNDTFLVLVTELMPVGLKGLMAAGLLAALMSTIAAALNSAATLVTVDIVGKIKPSITDRQQVLTGRVTTVVVMVLAILWSPFVGQFRSIFDAINVLLSVIAPPIATVFVMGVFWKRGTRQAANVTLVTGFLLGVAVFLLDFPVIGDVKLFTEVYGIPFLMQAWWLFVTCCIIYAGISLVTKPPGIDQIKGLCFDSPLSFLEGSPEGAKDPRMLSALLILIMVVLYYLFQ